MKKPDRIFLVCCSFRQGRDPQGKCHKKGSTDLLGPLQEGLADRDLDNAIISTSGCLNVCDNGPVLAVYPDGYWYGNVTEDSLEDILDALEEDQPCEEHLIALSSN
jgi:(2Fe-2S) ferredoxin